MAITDIVQTVGLLVLIAVLRHFGRRIEALERGPTRPVDTYTRPADVCVTCGQSRLLHRAVQGAAHVADVVWICPTHTFIAGSDFVLTRPGGGA